MDYKEKVIALLNSQELSKEQKEKLEEIFPELAESEEVNLEEEIKSQIRLLNGVHTIYNGKQWWEVTYKELSYFAKYFFELGMAVNNKAQKGK